jgi:REP element-mobilizing transposase RayT
MPNHIHLLCKMLQGWELGKTVHSWKSYTAHKANEILKRTGQFWMVDYYDRYIRDETHFLKTIKYIKNNGPQI